MVLETPEVHASSRFDVGSPVFEVNTSGHAREGILLARGPSFRGGTIEGAHITDITPTVLHALGYRLPESMDGDVLDLFEPGTGPATRDPITYEYTDTGDTSTRGGIEGDEQKEDEVKNRLRELGYLE
jgi:hypothetical protein